MNDAIAVAVPPVERVLGGPEVGNRLAALVNVVELCVHQAAQDPATTVCRQHSDQRHSSGADESAGDARLEGEDPTAADDCAVIERRVHAVGGQHRSEALDEVLGWASAAPK